MSARSLNWLKFGGLVALAFRAGVCCSPACSTCPIALQPRNKGRTASAIAPVAAPSIPAARPLQELSEAFAAVAEHVKPSVVYIRSQRTEARHASAHPAGHGAIPSRASASSRKSRQGSGSGFIVLGRRLHPHE